MKLSLDANIIIYAYITGKNIKNERKRREWVQLHEKADVLYTDVLKGKHVVIIPSVIVAEVCAGRTVTCHCKNKRERNR